MERQINDSNIKKFIELNYNKLIILFFVKYNDFLSIENTFKSFCMTNKNYTYYIIDLSKFDGTSDYISNIQSIPQFDIYFFNNILCSSIETDSVEINKILINIFNKISTFYYEQMANVNIIKNQILDIAKTQDIQYYQRLQQDPVLLQTVTNSNIFKGHCNQTQNNIPTNTTNKSTIKIDRNMEPLDIILPKNNISTPSVNVPNPQSLLLNNELIPTLQQMQYMFKIFTMMQQMGILDIPIKNESHLSVSDNDEQPIILKNGDKIIKLSDGKYGLIKNLN